MDEWIDGCLDRWTPLVTDDYNWRIACAGCATVFRSSRGLCLALYRMATSPVIPYLTIAPGEGKLRGLKRVLVFLLRLSGLYRFDCVFTGDSTPSVLWSLLCVQGSVSPLSSCCKVFRLQRQIAMPPGAGDRWPPIGGANDT